MGETSKAMLNRLLGEIKVRQFPAKEFKSKLDSFANTPYAYLGKELRGCFSPAQQGAWSSTPMLVDPKSQRSTRELNRSVLPCLISSPYLLAVLDHTFFLHKMHN